MGECAGTHGIARPGGSALNAGQVGGLRAAQYIASHPNPPVDKKEFLKQLDSAKVTLKPEIQEQMSVARRRMSDNAAAVRDAPKIKFTLEITLKELAAATDPRLKELLATQCAVLTAMANPLADPEMVQQVTFTHNGFEVSGRKVRPLPEKDDFFENVWRGYRENKNVY